MTNMSTMSISSTADLVLAKSLEYVYHHTVIILKLLRGRWLPGIIIGNHHNQESCDINMAMSVTVWGIHSSLFDCCCLSC